MIDVALQLWEAPFDAPGVSGDLTQSLDDYEQFLREGCLELFQLPDDEELSCSFVRKLKFVHLP
jgi:hypothetical protein